MKYKSELENSVYCMEEHSNTFTIDRFKKLWRKLAMTPIKGNKQLSTKWADLIKELKLSLLHWKNSQQLIHCMPVHSRCAEFHSIYLSRIHAWFADIFHSTEIYNYSGKSILLPIKLMSIQFPCYIVNIFPMLSVAQPIAVLEMVYVNAAPKPLR